MKTEADNERLYDEAHRVMKDVARALIIAPPMFNAIEAIVDRRLRLEKIRESFEADEACPPKRRRRIADTPPEENVADTQANERSPQATPSSRSPVDHGKPVSPAAEEFNRPVVVLDAD